MAERYAAYVLVVTSVGKEQEVAEQLKQLNYVKRVENVYGEYDLVIEVEAPNSGELKNVLEQVRRNSSIMRTVTLIMM
ncbi:Lrp/AsnC ligand binding domain-containing protein [Sulfuracidifex tepidarius]|uniref:HTH-type transcriptional regulator n=1 Tax=Sulfuracidifex tepidarius TaxID=1294262 RepID=A0A510DYF5_9CREN|nr:Lrp/AsnC ligand binding domain-containing protein [Sulfuracidifex tepidarius]BBG25245.1 putative HTH-type transcriptional regulator [Sulfuracidifex tepidarius]BBG28039.1 putative HTH-type transcriptional regulator [Sulfuracidifex tepidarius]